MAKVDSRAGLHDKIDAIQVGAQAIAPDRMDKLDQLASALNTAHMVVDDLFDTNPFVPPQV